jgi:hypothetical protein
MLPETPRPPYPITWDEQDRLFPKLPAHLGRMVLFAVNTVLRVGCVTVTSAAWSGVGKSRYPRLADVFVIPPEAFKARRPHVVISIFQS